MDDSGKTNDSTLTTLKNGEAGFPGFYKNRSSGIIRPERDVLVDNLDPVALLCDRPDDGTIVVLCCSLVA